MNSKQSYYMLDWFETKELAQAFVKLFKKDNKKKLNSEDRVSVLGVKGQWRVYLSSDHMMLTVNGLTL